MAIDMTTVKQIMHNNKEVAKIEDSLGNILWQKQVSPTLTYYVNMFTIRSTTSKRDGYFDINMFNGSSGTLVDFATTTNQYFCLLTASEFWGFNTKTLASGTTIGNTFNSSAAPGTTYRLCYIENNTAYIVGGGTTVTNDTPIGYSTSWSSASEAQLYPAVGGTNTNTRSEMFRAVSNNTANLRINSYKKPVYHTQTDGTGFTIDNRQVKSFTM